MENPDLSLEISHKRKFTPCIDSDLGDSKRRKVQKNKNLSQDASRKLDNSQNELDLNLDIKCAKVTLKKPLKLRMNNRSKTASQANDSYNSNDISAQPKFKARKIPKSMYNPKILKSNSDRPLTQPLNMTLHTDIRGKTHKNLKITEESQIIHEFKALPLNKKILDKPDFILKKVDSKTTRPKEFRFETAIRAKLIDEEGSKENINKSAVVSIKHHENRRLTDFNKSFQESSVVASAESIRNSLKLENTTVMTSALDLVKDFAFN